MRPIAGVIPALLLFAACSTPADLSPTPTATTLPDGPVRGVLPDGTVYDVILEPLGHESVTDVSAGVVEDGRVREIGFEHRDGDWSTDPQLDTTTHLGLPMVELSPSLRWADDEQVPMQVTYETFAVRRGCGEEAVACNPTQAVQAVPLDGWSGEEATVVSYALRRPDNPHYIDPGPLSGRSGHDLLWTGDEMIVWGGTGPPRTDGAAFDPDTGTWRTLAPVPLEDGPVSRAVWADTEMIVVTEEATTAYDPGGDSWATVGEGVETPVESDRAVWTGDQVVVWTGEGILALADGTWNDLGDPFVDGGVLRMAEGRLFAVGPEACEDRTIREWDGERWEEVAALPDESPVCPLPRQTDLVGDRVVTWQDDNRPTLVRHLEQGAWQELEPAPLASIDRPSGPLRIGDRLLVGRGAEGAIFDPGTGEWQAVDLPGYGTDTTMVWTGEEVIMWDRCCYEPDDVDAWRWTPPARRSEGGT